jgi:hypothetical protein
MTRALPAPIAILLGTLAALFGTLAAVRGLADADYYWHITAGELVARSGVLQTDPFSFTWAGQPWTMHEWLGELLMYRLVDSLGPTWAAFAFGVIAFGGPMVVAVALHREGVPARALAPALALVSYVFTTYVTIRPQAISWLLLGVLIAAIVRMRPDQQWRPWLIPVLFAVWSNVHGLYVVGLGVLALFTLFSAAGRTIMSPRRGTMVAVLGLSIGATMLTPAGPIGVLYPLRYLEPGDWGLSHIAEWRSPDFHDPIQLGLLLLIGVVVWNGMRGSPSWMGAASAAGIVGALLSTRNAPIAALLALAPLAYGLAARGLTSSPAPSEREATVRRVMEMAAAAVILIGAASVLPKVPNVAGTATIAQSFPVTATAALEGWRPEARVFAEYHWAGYVIHELHDEGGTVFVDGRNDMYPQHVLDDFVTVRNAEPGWERLLRGYGIEAVLLPPEAPLVDVIGWCQVHRDGVAVLLIERCG